MVKVQDDNVVFYLFLTCNKSKGKINFVENFKSINIKMKKLFIVFILLSLIISNETILPQDSLRQNLGVNINTKYPELSPVITYDGKTLYFVRRQHPQNLGFNKQEFDDDIWYSVLNSAGNWTDAKNIGTPLNNECFSNVCSVSPDGNTLLLMGVYETQNCARNFAIPNLYFTHRTSTGWSTPEKVTIKNFFNKNKFANFFLTGDGVTLLMAVEGKDSKGDQDIYVSFLTGNNEFSEPINLGSVINTNGKELSPFLAADGVTLYFSSTGHKGFGDADVFMSRRLDNSWTKWSEPVNLGKPINTDGWDADYVIPASGEYVYFVSTTGGYGAEDIFRMKLPENFKPKPVVLISGKVINAKTKQPVDANLYFTVIPENKETGKARTDPATGEYKYTLQIGSNYRIRAEAKDFVFSEFVFVTTNITDYTETEKDIELSPVETGKTVKLNFIYFDLNSSTLRSESYPELDNVVSFLNQNPEVKIEIGGHTDSTGTDDLNNKLSEARAKSVKEYIISKGINEKRITHKGYGKTKPITSNSTPEGMQMNRRVEFKILGSDYVETKPIKDTTSVKKDVIPQKNDVGEKLLTINFEPNEVYLTRMVFIELDLIVKMMLENTSMEILIAGYSDSQGGEEVNMKLSQSRAKAVREYILSKNIPESRVSFKGFGIKNPIASNDTEQGRNKNRRVEIVVTKK